MDGDNVDFLISPMKSIFLLQIWILCERTRKLYNKKLVQYACCQPEVNNFKTSNSGMRNKYTSILLNKTLNFYKMLQ